MTAPYKETTMRTLLSRSKLKDIFSSDEFMLFYRCFPSKSVHLKLERSDGVMHNKLRIIGIATGNVFGERLPISVIGKPKEPRCFNFLLSLSSSIE